MLHISCSLFDFRIVKNADREAENDTCHLPGIEALHFTRAWKKKTGYFSNKSLSFKSYRRLHEHVNMGYDISDTVLRVKLATCFITNVFGLLKVITTIIQSIIEDEFPSKGSYLRSTGLDLGCQLFPNTLLVWSTNCDFQIRILDNIRITPSLL